MQQEFDAMNGTLSNIRKWRRPKRASKELLRGCNSAEKCHLIFTLSWMALKQREDFNPPYQLTFLFSVCSGGSRALERSAIFCKRRKQRDTVFLNSNWTIIIFNLYKFFYVQHSATGAALSMHPLKKELISYPSVFMNWRYFVYLLQISIALHRFWEFSL